MIRPFEQNDIKALVDIYNSYVRETTYTLDLDPITEEELLLHINHAKFCFVATDKEKVLGYGYVSSFSMKSGYDITGVVTMYLDQYATGFGFGKKMLAELEKASKNIGINQLYSIISHTNDRSLSFFKSKGYKEVACLDKVAYKHGQHIDVFYLRNVLK